MACECNTGTSEMILSVLEKRDVIIMHLKCTFKLLWIYELLFYGTVFENLTCSFKSLSVRVFLCVEDILTRDACFKSDSETQITGEY